MTQRYDDTLPRLDDEEDNIRNIINGCRNRILHLESKKREIDTLLKLEKARLEQSEQAALDYMIANGLTDSKHFAVTTSRSVEVPDESAVPEKYIRIKREVNKALIRAEMPEANWYVVKENSNLKIKEQQA